MRFVGGMLAGGGETLEIGGEKVVLMCAIKATGSYQYVPTIALTSEGSKVLSP